MSVTYDWFEEQIIWLYLLHLTSTSFKYSDILKKMKCFNFADLSVTVEATIVITVCTPLTNISRASSFQSNLFQSLLSATYNETNLVQPGCAPVQSEDVTERGVRRLLHWGRWHITYSYACWTREQIRISSVFWGYLRRKGKFGGSWRGVSSFLYKHYWQLQNVRASWWK